MKVRILILSLLLSSTIFAQQNNRPNILLITADDMGYHSLGVTGSKVPEISPNIDRLSNEGIRFDHAFVNTSVCEPSRGVMGTGLYPNNSGITGFFPTEKEIPTLAEELKTNGYQVGILGKVKHSTPKDVASYVWDYNKDADELGSGRGPKLYKASLIEFIKDSEKNNKPFFMMANSHDPHHPFFEDSPTYERKGRQRPSRIYTVEDVDLPGFLPGLPEVKLELSQYFSSVKRLDDTVGALLEALEETGQADNTIVVFLSDHGMPFAFAKSNVYLASTHTPLIIKWGNEIKKTKVDKKHFVSTIDLMPTLLELTETHVPEKLDGRSFASILKGKKQKDRDVVFTHYNENSGAKSFPMRAIQKENMLYIFNPWAVGGKEYKMATVSKKNKSFNAMRVSTDPEVKARADYFLYRTVEEMYDLDKDPNALNNLIADKNHSKDLKELSTLMTKYLTDYKDLDILDLFNHRTDEEYLVRGTDAIQKEVNRLKKERRKASGGKNNKKKKKNKNKTTS